MGVTLIGDFVLTKDQKTVADRILKAFGADKALPQAVKVGPTEAVKNPFV